MLTNLQKLKYKKIQKGKLKKLEYKANKLTFGTHGLKAMESGIISMRQIQAAKQNITKKIKRKGKLWVKICPILPISAKSSGARMGKGKGAFSHWAAKVAKGTIIFEICAINFNTIYLALRTGAIKLPVKTKIFN